MTTSAAKVITFPSKSPLHAQLAALYETLAKEQGFIARSQQKEFSAEIIRAIRDNVALAAEAPTGTGKTIAYLAGALIASHHFDIPIVVAPHTVALQNQVLEKDLPRFVKAGLIEASQVVLAKGRGRYFCPREAELLVDADKGHQTDMFGDVDARASNQDRAALAAPLLKAWHSKKWNGDLDEPPSKEKLTALNRRQLGSDRDTCVGKMCSHFEECPYYTAKARLGGARLVVANQSLILADLKLRQAGLEPLLPYPRYALIVDEADHWVPTILKSSEAVAYTQLPGTLAPQMDAFCEDFFGMVMLQTAIGESDLTESALSGSFMLAAMGALITRCSEMDLELGARHRFVKGGSSKLQAQWQAALIATREVSSAFEQVVAVLKEEDRKASKEGRSAGALFNLHTLFSRAVKLSSKLVELRDGLAGMLSPGRVKWVEAYRDYWGFHSSAQDPALLSTELLWDIKIPVILTSATLTTGGSFDFFKSEIGLPETGRTIQVASSFDYSQCFLDIVKMPCDPNTPDYAQEVGKWLNSNLVGSQGSLILFTAKESMRTTTGMLTPELKKLVLMQDAGMSNSALVREHKRRIDAGEGSILVGVDTFSVGLDLPGNYCEHVIITKLPFEVPTHPVEQDRRARMGPAYFEDYILPKVSRKLQQMVGRLMRRETDRGIITLLDPRIDGKQYGHKILADLPNFKKRRHKASRLGFNKENA